jgi:signal transduction histidine kinase
MSEQPGELEQRFRAAVDRAERLTAGLNRVLELLATGGTQPAVLTALVKMVEQQCRGVVASVLILDETGHRLRHAAAPDLPAAFVRAADGLEIGPTAGSCGTAAFRGERVVVEDLQASPLWESARELAARHQLKACWSQPIFSADGQVLGTFALYPDTARGPDESEIHLLESAAHVAGVTIEHDRAQAALRRAKEEAEAANAAKDDFLATVSHELRTPIGAVLLWAKLLRSGNLDPDQQRQALDTIVRAAEDQKRLVNTLLDASRILHGRVQAELRPLALAKLVRDAVAAMRPSAEAKGVELHEVLCEAPALGDPPLLRQVVTNLVDNALKFTPKGGRVQVRLTREKDAAQIEVADTGAGMSPEFLPHAFDRFRQGEPSLDRAHGGLGLGLSIVRGLVELHGGTVRAASDGPGRGSTFVVTLPLSGGRPARR